ncbi:hypothetical protein HK104_010683 [Borealophlyctis nickersoniae]|nr:hypothetical protein HK104_010683 [Borealophlyctis nickersoniae]
MKSEIQVIRANGGKIPCPLRPTDANAKNPSLGLTCDSYLSEHSILRTLTPAHIARFVEALRKGMEVAITNEQLALSNTSSSSTTPAPKPNTPSLDKQDISRKRHHVVTEILNLKRPCCGFVLPDWTGCCAVTCDRCLAGRNSFCGICLRMDGPDAHKHIHRMHPGQMFLSEQKIKEVHQKLRHERLVGYFATMDAAVARAVMKDVTVFLEGTGVIGQAILREADRRRNDGGFRVRANGVLNPTPDEIQVQEKKE